MICAILFAAMAVVANPVRAGECCGCDPIYDRNENGEVIISAYVRDFPCTTDSKILTTVVKGSVISVIGYTDGWNNVRLSNGTEGWVGAALMQSTSKALTTTGSTGSSGASTETAASLARYKGYIFLDVQSHGEAYYYYPVNLRRYYLGRAADAFDIMRKLGLGATHSFISNTTYFPDYVVGRILLDVQSHGEAYYIYPKDKKKYYLGRPEDAYNIMRTLGLGITSENLGKISTASIQ